MSTELVIIKLGETLVSDTIAKVLRELGDDEEYRVRFLISIKNITEQLLEAEKRNKANEIKTYRRLDRLD